MISGCNGAPSSTKFEDYKKMTPTEMHSDVCEKAEGVSETDETIGSLKQAIKLHKLALFRGYSELTTCKKVSYIKMVPTDCKWKTNKSGYRERIYESCYMKKVTNYKKVCNTAHIPIDRKKREKMLKDSKIELGVAKGWRNEVVNECLNLVNQMDVPQSIAYVRELVECEKQKEYYGNWYALEAGTRWNNYIRYCYDVSQKEAL